MKDKLLNYVDASIQSFVGDPPEDDFQRGYLSALLDINDEILDGKVKIDQVAHMVVGPDDLSPVSRETRGLE